MFALRKKTAGKGIALEPFELDDTLGDEQILVKVHAAGICGSDLHLMDWPPNSFDWLKDKLPVTLGHEFSGTVEKIGSKVSSFQKGQKLIVQPTIFCNGCDECLNGRHEYCSNLGFVGVTVDGAFCQYVKVPENRCFPLKDDTDLTVAAMAEPLAVAQNAISQASLNKESSVVILGPGTIGQSIALLAQLKGVTNLMVVGKGDRQRLLTCKSLGVTHTVDLDETCLENALSEFFSGKKIDVVFEATGQSISIENAIDSLKVGGQLICTGIHEKNCTLDINKIVRKRLSIKGSYGSTDKDWFFVRKVIEENPDLIRKMISHELPLKNIEDGFFLAKEKSASKILIFPRGEE